MSRNARFLFQIFTTLLQIAAFGALFLFGGAWAEIRLGLEMNAMMQHRSLPPMIPLWIFHLRPAFDYVANGFIFASILLVLILLFEGLRKRFHPWALLTLLAFLIAFAYSLVRHSGFVPLTS